MIMTYLIAYPSNRQKHKYCKVIGKFSIELKFSHASTNLYSIKKCAQLEKR